MLHFAREGILLVKNGYLEWSDHWSMVSSKIRHRSMKTGKSREGPGP